MPYVGRDLQRGNYLKLDDIGSSFNGSTTTFNLTSGGNAFFPGSAFSILVSLGGVVQEPESAYQIDRSQIIFATAPTSSSDFFCIALGVALGVGVPGHNTVGNNQLAKPISYGDYFRWDSANNRVGINTLLPSTALDVVGDATFSGNVAIGGTLTYEDVANIDAVGIITARAGIEDKTLTAGRVVYVGSNGRLVDNSNLTYSGTSIGVPQIVVGSALTANSTGIHVSGVSTFRDEVQIRSGNQIKLSNDANTANATIDCDGGARLHLKSYNQSVATFEEGVGTIFYQSNGTARLTITPTGGVEVGAGGTIKIPEKIMHSGDEDTFMKFDTNTISFETAGTQRLKIDSVPGDVSTNISIGSSSGSNSDNYYLAIRGYERSSQGANGDTVNIGIINQSGDAAATANIDFRLGQAAISNTAAVRLLAGKTGGWTNTTSTRDGYFAISIANNAQVEEKLRITNSGRVGINTNVPLSGTHISDGTAYGSPQNSSRKATLTISAGSEASADIQLLSANYNHIFFGDSADPNTGIIHYEHTGSNVDNLVFSTAGGERLRINNTGSIVKQIFTATNTYSATDTTQCGYQSQNLSDTTNTYSALRLTAGNSSPATAQLSSIRTGAGANDFTIQLETGNTAFEAFRIKSTGQVLIGTNTVSTTNLVVYSDGTEDNKPATLYQNSLTGTGAANGFYVGSNHNEKVGYVWNYENDKVVFATSNTGRVGITTTGQVNIGGDLNQTTYTMKVTGSFAATTKSFVIDHPTKEKHKLRYACLEGPENSVYVRGKTSDSVIELPDYWTGLVHEDSITVNVTPIGNHKVWVESINNNSVTIGSDGSEYFYTVFAERKDVDKLEVEVEE